MESAGCMVPKTYKVRKKFGYDYFYSFFNEYNYSEFNARSLVKVLEIQQVTFTNITLWNVKQISIGLDTKYRINVNVSIFFI